MTATPDQATARAFLIRKRRARIWVRRLLLFVGLPTLASVLYYGLIASDVYESTTIVSAGRGSSGDAGGCARKAALVKDVFLSRAEILGVAHKLNLTSHYGRGDLLARLSGSATQEQTYNYLREQISLSDPSPACTMTITVKAFAPAVARDTAGTLIAATNARLFSLGNQDQLPDTGPLVFVNGPSLPDFAAYPRRWWSVITVMVVSLVAVGVVSLFAGAIREHAKL